MKFSLRPSDTARQLLLLQGVPRSLLGEFKLDLTALTNYTIVRETRDRIVLANRQRRWFRQIHQQLPLQPILGVCASTEFYLQARRAALILFCRYLQFSMN